MYFSLSPEAACFRAEARRFLDASLDEELRRAADLTVGIHAQIDASQRWYRKLAEKGWIAPSWPVEYGGTGWSPLQCHIFNLECFQARAPLLCQLGIRHLGPVLMAHGTPEQRARFIPPILSGEHIWCQGYSEPSAGSDLAALSLRAERVNDEYRLNGTKLWTTGAHCSTHICCLVRTAQGERKQDGITYLLIDMSSPGLTVEPIISISGDHELNQVFFEDVRVPVTNRVGAENDGWRVAKDQMQFARSNNVNTGWVRQMLLRLGRLCHRRPEGRNTCLADDPAIRQRLSEADIRLQGVEMLELRVLSDLSVNRSPGALTSMLKTRASEVKQQITELAMQAAAYHALPFQPQLLDPTHCSASASDADIVTAMPAYLNERAATIYSGASEIQRDVLAKRVLAL